MLSKNNRKLPKKMVGKINFNLAEIGWKKHQNLVAIA